MKKENLLPDLSNNMVVSASKLIGEYLRRNAKKIDIPTFGSETEPTWCFKLLTPNTPEKMEACQKVFTKFKEWFLSAPQAMRSETDKRKGIKDYCSFPLEVRKSLFNSYISNAGIVNGETFYAFIEKYLDTIIQTDANHFRSMPLDSVIVDPIPTLRRAALKLERMAKGAAGELERYSINLSPADEIAIESLFLPDSAESTIRNLIITTDENEISDLIDDGTVCPGNVFITAEGLENINATSGYRFVFIGIPTDLILDTLPIEQHPEDYNDYANSTEDEKMYTLTAIGAKMMKYITKKRVEQGIFKDIYDISYSISISISTKRYTNWIKKGRVNRFFRGRNGGQQFAKDPKTNRKLNLRSIVQDKINNPANESYRVGNKTITYLNEGMRYRYNRINEAKDREFLQELNIAKAKFNSCIEEYNDNVTNPIYKIRPKFTSENGQIIVYIPENSFALMQKQVKYSRTIINRLLDGNSTWREGKYYDNRNLVSVINAYHRDYIEPTHDFKIEFPNGYEGAPIWIYQSDYADRINDIHRSRIASRTFDDDLDVYAGPRRAYQSTFNESFINSLPQMPRRLNRYHGNRVNESVRNYNRLYESFESADLDQIIKEHGGFSPNFVRMNRTAHLPMASLTDENVIAVIDVNQNPNKAPIGMHEFDFLDDLHDLGYDFDTPDDAYPMVFTVALSDHTYLVFVLTEDQYYSWDNKNATKYWGRDLYNDDEYYPSTSRGQYARDLRTNPSYRTSNTNLDRLRDTNYWSDVDRVFPE